MNVINLNKHNYIKINAYAYTHKHIKYLHMYSNEVLCFFAIFWWLLTVSDNVAILCNIGHEVAHVIVEFIFLHSWKIDLLDPWTIKSIWHGLTSTRSILNWLYCDDFLSPYAGFCYLFPSLWSNERRHCWVSSWSAWQRRRLGTIPDCGTETLGTQVCYDVKDASVVSHAPILIPLHLYLIFSLPPNSTAPIPTFFSTKMEWASLLLASW